MRIAFLKFFSIFPENKCSCFSHISSDSGIIFVSYLKNNLVKFLFLSAVSDMIMIVFYNSVFSVLLCVILFESIVKQFVIYICNWFSDYRDVVFYSLTVNIFSNKCAVVMSKIALAYNSADSTFFYRIISFFLMNLL